MILDTIKETIFRYNLIDGGKSILIGLSGGGDSVCLTHTLFSLCTDMGIKLYTAHLNHGIRGQEAERDEHFAMEFSNALGITCFTEHVNIPEIAKNSGESEETAGRRIRYEFFNRLCKAHNIDFIATAHNRNDNAETLLMNFMRGSSLNGLCGIPYKRGNIIRPLLDVTRDEIEKYCADNLLTYMTDSTNLENDYTRNKIRNILIPLIKNEFNTNFINTVSDNAALIKDDNDYIENAAAEKYAQIVKNNSISISEFISCDIALQRRIIRLMLKSVYEDIHDIPAKYISDIIDLAYKQSGSRLDLRDDVAAYKEYDKIFIAKKIQSGEEFEYTLEIDKSVFIKELNKTVTVSRVSKRMRDGSVYLSGEGTVIIRNRRSGDKFHPYGMNGTKKLKQFFTDKKIPLSQRSKIPIILMNGKIAAVGDRVDRDFLFENKGIKIKFE